MNTTETQLKKQIEKLYKQIVKDAKDNLFKCIGLGEILESYKGTVPKGNFENFINNSLPFTARTGRNYMSLFHHKENIEKRGITSVKEAYRLIHNYNNWLRDKGREETKKFRKEFPNQTTKYTNPKTFINKIICGDCNQIMQKMLTKGMAGKYSAVITSPPYNASMDYGSKYNDSMPYQDYLDFILKPFDLYSKLLKKGGRVIYIVPTIVKNTGSRDRAGEYYNHQFTVDLCYRIREEHKNFKYLTSIIWNKSIRKNPVKNDHGSFCSPLFPTPISAYENILVWSNEQFELYSEHPPDITEDEFQEWKWNVWSVAPFAVKNNPHPCSTAPKLIERILKYFTYTDDLILDTYAGVCVTAQVCKKLKRNFTCIELNANYCNWAKQKL